MTRSPGNLELSFFTRRRFLSLSAMAAAAPLAANVFAQEPSEQISQPITGTLRIDEKTALHSVPLDFTGLSYESAQLANPNFFSASSHQLIHIFRKLSPCGVLRLGGGTSDYTTYSAVAPAGPPPFIVFGPDTSKTAKKGTITSALALQNLRAFLDATNWSCLYGLNLGQGTKANAVAEAEAAYRILGPRLTAFQIGNEPDTFRHFRNNHYSPQQFVHEWVAFHDAIVRQVPHARFAGPDISNNLSYLTAFAAIAPHYRDIVLLTLHYYAMGPAGNPRATLENLLSPNPQLTTLKWSKMPVVLDAMRTAHLPCRISEVNSCWNGGESGASNVFASALWCADMMLRFASYGISGVNLHGGGYGIYSPIVGSPESGFTPRPEFFGIQFAQRFAGATLLHSDLQCTSNRINAYAGHIKTNGRLSHRIAFINKTGAPASITLRGTSKDTKQWHCQELLAPSLTSTSDITTKHYSLSDISRITLSPHCALLLNSDE